MAKKTTQTPADLLAAVLVPKEAQPYAIPANWRWVRLGSVCEFERGITFPASAKESAPTEENIPCLRTANVQDQLEIDDLIYVNKSYMKKNDAKLVRQGDIVMSSANSRELVGKTSFVESLTVPMTFGGFVLMIRAKQIANKFLFYFLRLAFLSGHFVGKASQTTNIANINTKTLAQDAIPLPPLAEQARIVARIETLFAQIDEAEEKLRAAADTFAARRAALLHAAFTGRLTAAWRTAHGRSLDEWMPKELQDVAQWGSGGTPSRRYPEYYGGNISWIKTGELNDGEIFSSEETITDEAIKNSSAKIYPENTVVVAMYGATIGKTGILKIEAATNQACACAVCGTEILYSFLFWFLRSQKQAFINSGKGGAQPNISQTILKHWPISLPPLDEQREIVRLLDEAFAEEERARQALEAARAAIPALRRAILARAFRGALGTGDPAEPPADLSAAR